MDRDRTLESFDECFYPSSKSPLGKARRLLWLGAILGIAIAAATVRNTAGSLTIFLVLTLLIFGAADWVLRRQLKNEDAAVILRQDGIESPLFTGPVKRYPWSEIAGASVESDQGGSRLQFRLAEVPGRPDRRSFWTGANPARPAIPLASLAPEAQERLLEEVGRRLREQGGVAGEAPRELENPLAEERAFQERLKALAPIPWITYLMIAINVLVWGLTVAKGAGVAKASAEQLLSWGGNAASEVQHGEWWRLLTATFLHGGLMHLMMNMLGLIGAGVTVERIYGHRLFLLIYLGSGLIGSGFSLHFSAQSAVSVGASGAVFGVTGALLVGVFQHRRQLPSTFGKQTLGGIAFFIAYSLMQGFAKEGIDNAAHVGGLLGGCLLAYLLPERFDLERFTRTLPSRALAGIAVVFAATAGLAAMAPPAQVEQRRLFESQPILLRALSGFEAAIRELQKEDEKVKAGRMTARESDERSRTVHAPVFRQLLQDFSLVYLAPSDPRLPLVKDTRRMTELILESLEMQSVFREGSDKPEPADPRRMAAIEAELREIGARFQKMAGEGAKQ